MSHTWFRLYDEVVDDPKVQLLSDRLFRVWINLMCVASKNHPRGTLPRLEDTAYRLHMSVPETKSLLNELIDAGLLEYDHGRHHCHNWDGRQFQSDVSTDRVKRFRKRHGNVSETVNVTSQKRNRETHQIQRQIQNKNIEGSLFEDPSKLSTNSSIPVLATGVAKRQPYALDFETFWAASTRRGSKLDASRVWKQVSEQFAPQEITAGMMRWKASEQWQDETKQPHVHRWLKRRGWEEIVPRSNDNERPQTKVDRTLANAQRLRDRLHQQDRRGGERGAEHRDDDGLPGTLDCTIDASNGSSDKKDD